MDTECSADQILFKRLAGRQVTAEFDGEAITSDAGLLLLREIEEQVGLIERLAACFEGHRDPDYIEHTVEELLPQRIFGLILGWEDLTDHDDLRRDFAVAVSQMTRAGLWRRPRRCTGWRWASSELLPRMEAAEAKFEATDEPVRIRRKLR
ncbi:MAG: transposase, partial [Bradymonadaceae bacterium]